MTTSARLPRGMRDLLPEAMRRRQYVTDTLRAVFETFGFEPLQTPAMEQASTLLGKYGPDAERLIYRAGLGAETDLALRYDLTVPLARVCASNADLPRPFKRYQIASVWRGERPQRGRYREFTQADVDIVGSPSLLADAEIITVVTTALDRLGFTDYVIKLNSRSLLVAIGRYAGVPEAVLPGLYRAIDKLDKIGMSGVRLELRAVGLPGDLVNRQRQAVGRWLRGQVDRERLARDLGEAIGPEAPPGVRDGALATFLDALAAYPNGGDPAAVTEAVVAEASEAVMRASIDALRAQYPPADLIPDAVTDRLLELLQLRDENRALLAELGRRLDDPMAQAGIAELGQVLDALDAAGVPAARCEVDFAMVRGLEYYTGTIFEAVVSRPPIGSILAGGRYDKLVALFGRSQPAVGTSFGVDRLVDVMEEVGLFPAAVDAPSARVLVTLFDAATAPAAVRLAADLRRSGLPAELSFEPARLGDQIRYALDRGIPAVAIMGPDEAAAGTVTLRDLATKTQATVPVAEAVAWLRGIGGHA